MIYISLSLSLSYLSIVSFVDGTGTVDPDPTCKYIFLQYNHSPYNVNSISSGNFMNATFKNYKITKEDNLADRL